MYHVDVRCRGARIGSRHCRGAQLCAPTTKRGAGSMSETGQAKLPPGWVWTTVQELGSIGEQTVLTGPFGTSLGREDFVSSGIPVLTISCLTDAGITLDKAVFVSEEKATRLERYRLKPGDLLFSRMASVGRVGIAGDNLQGALINYHIMRLRFTVDETANSEDGDTT